MRRINTPQVQQFEQDHISAVRALAPECMVLLKKDGRLPLDQPCRIAAYGRGVRHTIKGGTGSGDVNSREFVTVEKGLENAGFTLTSKDWLDSYDHILEEASAQFRKKRRQIAEETGQPIFVVAFGAVMPEPEYELPLDLTADCAVYVLSRISGEGNDRGAGKGDIGLSETEVRDILTLARAYERFALILNVGGMVDLTPIEQEVGNILLMSQLGAPSGDALADVLLGKSYPSGKLTMTWAPIAAYPSTEGFGDPNDTFYKEGIYVGYRYFDSFKAAKTYPFGYGLGYTEFASRVVAFEADEEEAAVSVEVENIGSRPGMEVVQLYYSAPAGRLDKPVKELAVYCKTDELAPGDSQLVKLLFSPSDMASYDTERASYVLEAGTYTILAGTDSDRLVVAGKLVLDEEVVTWKLKNVGGSCGFEDLKPQPETVAAVLGSYTDKAEGISGPAEPETVQLRADCFDEYGIDYADLPEEMEGKAGSMDDVLQGRISMEEFTGSLSDEQLAYLCVGAFKPAAPGADLLEVIGNASFHVAGAAGETTGRLEELGVEPIVMADGPAGIRVSQEYRLEGENAIALTSNLDFSLMEESGEKPEGKDAAKDLPEGSEVFYQYCTAIPIGTALAQSWNDDLCRKCGDIVGEEMELFGVNLWLAPAMNIMRNPRCGRNFEYFSEDPLISGMTAAAITEGVQKHEGCGTTIKHFCCNNQETNRYFSNSILSERALREIYLKGFEICVTSSQPRTLMTSYNLINGEHACSRRDLVTDVLRDEWGFDGFVMTDWLVTGGMGPGGEKHPCASAAGCVRAGNDVVMPGIQPDYDDILNALKDEKHPYHLTRAILQQDAERVLRMCLRC